jgi:hypothetical protein
MDIYEEMNTNKLRTESCEVGEKYGLANKCKQNRERYCNVM